MGFSRVGSNIKKFVNPDPVKDARRYEAIQAAGQAVEDGIDNPYPKVKRRNLRKVDLLDGEDELSRKARLKEGWDKQSEAMYGKDAGKWFDGEELPPPVPGGPPPVPEVNLDKMIHDIDEMMANDPPHFNLDELVSSVDRIIDENKTPVISPNTGSIKRKTG